MMIPGAFRYSDPLIIIILTCMMALGMLGVLSAGLHLTSDPFFYLQRQLLFLAVGTVAFLLGALINHRIYRVKTQIPYLFTILLLALVFAFGKQSWLIVGRYHFQPSELGKLVIIFYLSYVLSFQRYRMEFKRHSGPMMFACALLIVPTALQPDFGTALIMTLIAVYMLFIGHVPLRHIVVPGLAALPGVALVPFCFGHVMGRLKNYLVLLSPQATVSELGYHDYQLRLAIGSGGFLGTGFGEGLVKRSFLPASHTDSIYAVLVEEGGFVTGAAVILLFMALLLIGERTAQNSRDNFSALLARGIVFYISMQAFLNIGVCLELLPNTGVTLPLFSYGGSSLIVTLYALGVLVNISSQRQILF